MVKISIITVVFNAENLIGRTIESVLKQTFKDFEHIIVDGNSTDKTIDVINTFPSGSIQVISEPDSGIYDAMNKGLKIASGEFVLFLNSGDELYDHQTLDGIFSIPESHSSDVLFGETMMTSEGMEELGIRSERFPLKLPKELNSKSLSRGMVVCHQSFVARREIVPFFDLNYKLCADIDWVIRTLYVSKKVINTNLIISKFLEGGTSRKYLFNSLIERFLVLQKHYGLFSNLANHFIILIRSLFFILKRRKGY